METAVPLLEASQRLEATRAEACSIKWLTAHLSVANCVGIWDAAGRFSCATLLERALEFFARHICEVAQSEGFLALESCKLIELTSDDSLCLRDERVVYDAVMDWVQHDLAARQALVCEVLSGVRLGLLPGPFLANEVGRDPLMQSNEAKELRIRAYDCKFQSSVEDAIGRQRSGAAYTVLLLEQHAGGTFRASYFQHAHTGVPPQPEPNHNRKDAGNVNRQMAVAVSTEDTIWRSVS